MYSQEYPLDKPEEKTDDVEVEETTLEAEKTREDEPQHSDAELKAMEKGWNPDGVEGKPFISAEEFLRNESFFDRIFKLERQNKQLTSSIDEMTKQHKKIAELERQKVIDELKARKKVALAEEDFDAVVDLDDKIAEARAEVVQESPSDTTPTTDPIYDKWVSKNTWYNESANPDLAAEADALGIAYFNRTGASQADVLEYVERTIKRLHPEQFEGHTRRPTSVEGATAKTPRKKAGPKSFSERDLNDVQRRVMDRYVRNGVMTKEEYIEELVKIGELN